MRIWLHGGHAISISAVPAAQLSSKSAVTVIGMDGVVHAVDNASASSAGCSATVSLTNTGRRYAATS